MRFLTTAPDDSRCGQVEDDDEMHPDLVLYQQLSSNLTRAGVQAEKQVKMLQKQLGEELERSEQLRRQLQQSAVRPYASQAIHTKDGHTDTDPSEPGTEKVDPIRRASAKDTNWTDVREAEAQRQEDMSSAGQEAGGHDREDSSVSDRNGDSKRHLRFEVMATDIRLLSSSSWTPCLFPAALRVVVSQRAWEMMIRQKA